MYNFSEIAGNFASSTKFKTQVTQSHIGDIWSNKDILIANLFINEIQIGLMKVNSTVLFIWMNLIFKAEKA